MKMNYNKKIICMLTLILVFLMLFTPILPVFAVTITTDEEELTGADIVREDEDKREKFSKHYLTGDGSYFAVAYTEQVNYLDDDGKWKEVDNTFTTNIFTGEKTTKNEKFKVKFANKANKEKLVSIQTDEFKVSWGILVSENGTDYFSLNKVKGVENEKLKTKEIKTTEDAQSLGKAVSGIIYENAYGDYLDVRYSVAHQKVKEDLIITEKSGFNSYKVTYDISKIKDGYVLQDNSGEVTFYNSEGVALFKAGIPVMYDSAGKSSADIQVNVISGKKTVEVIYTPSSTWLNDSERVYPVTIDPELSTSQYTSNIMDTSVYYTSAYSTTNANAVSPYLYMGMDYTVYIKIFNVPSVTSQYTVLGCNLIFMGDYLSVPPDSATSFFVKTYNVCEYWNEYMFMSCESDFVYDPDIDYFELQTNRPEVGTMITSDISALDNDNLSLSLDLSGIYSQNGGYNNYFSYYYGFEIYMHWYHSYHAFSSESNGVHPYIVTRYELSGGSDNQYTDINSSEIFRIKSLTNQKYLTFNDTTGTASTQLLSFDYLQGFKFIYNATGNYYTIQSDSDNPNYISYQSTPDNQNNYPVTISNTANYHWKVYLNDDDTFSILSESSGFQNYALTSMNYSWDQANNDVVLSVYSTSNNHQRWILEGYYDNPSCYDRTITVNNYTDEFIVEKGEKVKLIFNLYVNDPLQSSDSDVVEIDNYNIITALNSGTVEIFDSSNHPCCYITVVDYLFNPNIVYNIGIASEESYLHREENSTNVCIREDLSWSLPKESVTGIWRFQMVGDAYKIYNMSVQAAENEVLSDNNLVLSYQTYNNSSYAVLKNDSANDDSLLWYIERVSSSGKLYYRFSPKNYPNKYLKMHGNTAKLDNKQEQLDEWTVSELEYEAYFEGTLRTSNDSNNANRKIIYCAASPEFYDNFLPSELQRAIDEWNFAPNLFKLQLVNASDGKDVQIWFDVGASSDIGIASMTPYMDEYTAYQFDTPEEELQVANSPWYRTVINIYLSVQGSINFTQITDDEKYGTILHEIGHALKLSHPNDITGSYASAYPAVMIQGTNEDNWKAFLTNFDKTAAILKWRSSTSNE